MNERSDNRQRVALLRQAGGRLVARYPLAARLLRFAFIGALTTGFYVLVYVLLRALFSLTPILSACLAYGAAVIFQYFGHSRVTFGQERGDARQMVRFFITIAIGFSVTMLITSVLWPKYQWPEFIAIALIVIIIPILNFIVFSSWVFLSRPVSRPE